MGNLADLLPGSDAKSLKANAPGLVQVAIATLSRLTETVSHIADLVEGAVENDVYLRRAIAIDTDAGGNGQTEIVIGAGVGYKLLSYRATVPVGAATPAALLFYIDGTDGNNLIAVDSVQRYLGANFAEGEYIPQLSRLIIRVEGAPVTSRIVVTLTAREYKNPPLFVRHRTHANG